jgi:hypothetical protein
MRGISRRRNPTVGRLSAAVAAVGAGILLAVSSLTLRDQSSTAPVQAGPPTTVSSLNGLGPQARCDSAARLVTAGRRWPMVCRWRQPGDQLQGQAFPPPPGDPPFDEPRIEIYVDPAQSADDLARAIAHELGHMHHTRDPRFVTEWLSVRNLPAGTPDELWTEDYAEVFAALFAPPSEQWRAPTSRPTRDDLVGLKSRFFGDA